MFGILVKKQMAEIFRGYFYDAKKNKKRSKISTILFMLMYVILMVGVFFNYGDDRNCVRSIWKCI